jgi:hypothetical protein
VEGNQSLLKSEILSLGQELYFVMLSVTIPYRVGPLLGSDRVTNNGTTAVATQRILNKQHLNYTNEERCFLCGTCRDVISGTILYSGVE